MSLGQYAPFLNGKKDCELFKKHFAGADLCRIGLDKLELVGHLEGVNQAWIDTGFDGFSRKPADRGQDWVKFIKQFGDSDFLVDPVFLEKPDQHKLKPIVVSMLDLAASVNPGYISVPQLAHTDGTENNKVNRLLASLAADWHVTKKANAKLILPLIFTHKHQLLGKTERTPKVKLASTLMMRSGAIGFWSVDSSLDDQKGTSNFDERFASIVAFYSELSTASPCIMRIAGPYWGLNLVLWARGLATHFAIGVGSTFNYHLTGGFFGNKAKTRVAVAALRRWIIVNNELEHWLTAAAQKLAPGSAERSELEQLSNDLPHLLQGDAAKRQIAATYKDWITKIESVAPGGRALALYQDLSSAFVTGRNLPELPSDEGTARRPERVAQQLMLNCL